jgi:uncharacterized protein YndB with AHSA1/START domain
MSKITVEATIQAPIDLVWKHYFSPESMMQWNHASSDWACKDCRVNLKEGGEIGCFMYEIQSGEGFEFVVTITKCVDREYVQYKTEDNRVVDIDFVSLGSASLVTITFDAENENPLELQKEGWQSILENFRIFCEEIK